MNATVSGLFADGADLAILQVEVVDANAQYTTCIGDDCYFTCNTELFVYNLFLLFSFLYGKARE